LLYFELLGTGEGGWGCAVHLVLNIHNCCGWCWDHKGSGRVCRGTQLQKFAAEPARNIAEWLVTGFSPPKVAFNLMVVRLGFVVDRWRWSGFLSKYFGFPLPFIP